MKNETENKPQSEPLNQPAVMLSLRAKKQVDYFITKRFFRNSKGKEIEQWWIYILKEGVYKPIAGTCIKKYKEAKKELLEELQK